MGGRKKNVVFFLDSLPSGGAERMRINLATEMLALGHRATLVLTRREGALLSEVPLEVKIVGLKASRTFLALWPLSQFLRTERPDVLVSSFGHNNIVAVLARALASAKTKIVITQHAALSAECKDQGGITYAALPALYRTIGAHADAILAVSIGVKDDLSRMTGIARDRISVINNPVVTTQTNVLAAEPVIHPFFAENSAPVFLAVGRLVPQKDFVTLIKAFSEVRKSRDARLAIIGEGPLKEPLQRLSESLNVATDVAFLGFEKNPLRFMSKSSALVMSSVYEGFGNVLVESLSVGTPVVSTDCPYGPAEILENGRYGILVPVGQPEALAAAMNAIIENRPSAALCKARANEFNVRTIAEAYLRLFDGC